MPFEESTTTPGQMNAMAQEAHLLRTKDRIAEWRNRLQDNPSEALKDVALEELKKYEQQLREPFTARALAKMNELRKLSGASPVERLVEHLQHEVAELKAKMTGQPSAAPLEKEDLVAHGA